MRTGWLYYRMTELLRWPWVGASPRSGPRFRLHERTALLEATPAISHHFWPPQPRFRNNMTDYAAHFRMPTCFTTTQCTSCADENAVRATSCGAPHPSSSCDLGFQHPHSSICFLVHTYIIILFMRAQSACHLYCFLRCGGTVPFTVPFVFPLSFAFVLFKPCFTSSNTTPPMMLSETSSKPATNTPRKLAITK